MAPIEPINNREQELSADALISIGEVHLVFSHLRASLPDISDSSGLQLSEADINSLKKHLPLVLHEIDFTFLLTDAGIPNGTSFTSETARIIKGGILPYLHPPKSAEAIIHQICSSKGDYELLQKVLPLLTAYAEKLPENEKQTYLASFKTQVINAVRIISYRIAALGMDEQVNRRAGRNEELLSPFMEQNAEVNELLANLAEGNTERALEDLGQAKVMLQHCIESITLIDKAAEENGASLHQTFILRKLELLIERLLLLLPILQPANTPEPFSALMKALCGATLKQTKRRKLREFVSRNINLIAYRITENKRKTGEHYVASSRSEYWEMFLSSCGGGFVVSIMVMLKMRIHHLDIPVFWESLLYGLNYAIGFVVIQALGFTLATKQPAMTAAYIAASMDDVRDDKSRYQHLAAMIATVSRSQIISFTGNLLVAFPLTLCWVFFAGLGRHYPVSPEEGAKLVESVHPLLSLSVWYAALTGALLFLSGIISGFGDNKVVVSRIGERLKQHPALRRRLPPEMLNKTVSYIERNLGPLLGNAVLGLLMGFTIFIGKTTGLPFDIRHITFSAGNVAIGLSETNMGITIATIVSVVMGVLLIGVINFAVSFTLAIQVGARSRGLRFKDYPDMIKAVLNHFTKYPAHFFYPPSATVHSSTLPTPELLTGPGEPKT
ncbi:MAG TPA: hypothetical protein VG603_16525 [Chitinophagales bacterium]|nr:hypothetical protein [Chitinophagales bacterium]